MVLDLDHPSILGGVLDTRQEGKVVATVNGFGWKKHGDYRNLNFLMVNELSLESFQQAVQSKSKLWKPGPSIDQKQTPHCVGFSGENWQLCSPTMDPLPQVVPGDVLYAECKNVDGDNQDGSTTNSLLKVLRDRGMIEKWVWAYNVNVIKAWILSRGPVFLGSYWMEGMMRPDANGFIAPSYAAVGGHETLITGYRASSDAFRIKNSWGDAWGDKGSCWIHASDLAWLLAHDGEAVGAVETQWRKKSQVQAS